MGENYKSGRIFCTQVALQERGFTHMTFKKAKLNTIRSSYEKNMVANSSEKTYTQNQEGFGHKSNKLKNQSILIKLKLK